MPETFLILLAGGTMLAGAISDPRAVTLRWLRLAGILALCFVGGGAYFAARRTVFPTAVLIPLIASGACVLGQIGFVQVAWRATQRWFSVFAFLFCTIASTILLYTILDPRVKAPNIPLLSIGCALCGAVYGLALMDMLLGHAYLNAAEMTMKPFIRLNRSLGFFMLLRAIVSISATFILQSNQPLEQFWNLFGLYIGTRWLVGFFVAGGMVWMAHDCIKRRATQSATGILYAADVLIFLGEIIGLYLMSETGIPI